MLYCILQFCDFDDSDYKKMLIDEIDGKYIFISTSLLFEKCRKNNMYSKL